MIHGGDPGPDGVVTVEVSDTTARLAAMLSASLAESIGAPAREEQWLRPALARLGIEYESGPNPCLKTRCRPGDIPGGIYLNGRWHCIWAPAKLLSG